MHRFCIKTLITIAISLICILQVYANNLVIGAKNFTEQLILSSITQQYLQAKGYKTSVEVGMASNIMRLALENKELDIVWDYTGTALEYNGVNEKLGKDEGYQLVKKIDLKKELIWLDPSKLNNTFVLAVSRKFAEHEGLRNLEDLAKMVNQAHRRNKKYLFGVEFEFVTRADGLASMESGYGFGLKRSELKQMISGLIYTALRNKQLDVGLAYSSDGRPRAFDLRVLKDNKKIFPYYITAPVVRKEVLDSNPKLAEQLNALSAKINTVIMSRMNEKVDIDQLPVNQVASDFLHAEGMI
jgi:osmoprotectant transport system substrate-binding protein